MPLMFSKRNISDAENRLRLLFCVDALGMVTREQLWPFVARLDLMEYVPMCLYVDELTRDGSLTVGVGAAEGALCITNEGQNALRLFSNRMPQNDRRRITAAAPDYAATLQEKRQIRAVNELAPDGLIRVACTVQEADLPTLFLRVETRRRTLANGAIKHFRLCAPRLLSLLFTLPTSAGGYAYTLQPAASLEAALASVEPERPMLYTFSRHEHAAVICLKAANVTLWLSLLMPSCGEATSWVNAALSQRGMLLERIPAMLQGRDDGK